MKNKRKIVFASLLVLIAGIVFVQGLSALSLEKAQEVLGVIDAQKNFEETDFSAVMTMVSEDPEEGSEKSVVRMFRRDAEDSFLMLIQEPTVKKGQGYLNIDDNLWFYDPESRKFSHTSMNDKFNNSDANNSDFRMSSLADDYRVASVEEGQLGSYGVYIFGLEARNSEVTYPTRKIWVSRENRVILKSEDYSAGGRLLRTAYFPSYAKLGDNTYIATSRIFKDELIDGKETRMQLTDISTRSLPDSIFTKSYVERVNR
jgi:outer membrane lipoprotein-sorting protein